MPDRLYMEDTLETVVNYLNDNFVTMLTAIRTERDDTVTPDPAEQYDDRIAKRGVTQSNRYPRIEVLPLTMSHDYGPEDAPLIRPWLIAEVVLRITHVAAHISEVENTLLRYSEAINRLQEADDTFGDQFNWVQLGDEDYSPMTENQETRQLRQQVVISMTCRSMERRA